MGFNKAVHQSLKKEAKCLIREGRFAGFIFHLNNNTYKETVQKMRMVTPVAPEGFNWTIENIPDDVPEYYMEEVDTYYLYTQKDLMDFLNYALLHNQKKIVHWLFDLTSSQENLNLFILNPCLFPIANFKVYAEYNERIEEIQNVDEIFAQLDLLKKKIAELETGGHHYEALSAYQLARNIQLELLTLAESQDPSAVEQFKVNCNKHVEAARNSRLSEHRGSKELLINISLAVLGVAVLYLVAASVNYYLTEGKHFFFKIDTDSEHMIGNLALATTKVH